MAYQPIENHAIIGDMHTVALVAMDGSIDWLCIPYFDSPSVFGALLDDKKGGFFKIAPLEHHVSYKQFYWPETNVLVTRFLSTQGAAELTDFMPVNSTDYTGSHRFRLIRRLTAVRGTISFSFECRPAFNYAQDQHETELTTIGAVFSTEKLRLLLTTDKPLEISENGVVSKFILREGQTTDFALVQLLPGSEWGMHISSREAENLFRQTVCYWRNWIARCKYSGRWREMVYRSALTLKLLTFKPTGAIIAAPTTSLPEEIGGIRNWDYRFSWIRDSAFTIYAFMRLGFTEEAQNYMEFLSKVYRGFSRKNPPLQIMYGIDGRHELKEMELNHLDGYKGSRPVRVGNGAYQQLQLDIYGELLDAVYLCNKYGAPISFEEWLEVKHLIEWVCENWQLEDEGIWEVRGKKRHFIYSKLMCWVALDRGLRLAEKRSFPADISRWRKIRNEIYMFIMEKGWNAKKKAFVQSSGSEALDASILMMPLVFFISPVDPMMLSTLQAIMRSSHEGGLLANNLVYRYNLRKTDDGLEGKEGTFNICTFWLVEALTRAGQYRPQLLEEAHLLFERMLGFANHVGLYAEEIGFSGEALGNFPQALTHLSLISAAYNLNKVLEAKEE
ncbi:glycoside hydrolase family 15 protein [Candidatus Methylacidiphilum fumarolicum]|uniref:GH15 family glucan-1,4-alpha-glucosidase n=2 Tax=Candidatus Methylacidiphilum fumarolicum TaxID=591154 RepID=A0ABM9IED3_9BACT|nr:glycoside hydrolase family 15 protein [Candidatus Methylacidiphilum fumarolicum]MBW6415239.1 glycoside hydrolase family 15 protein [Candidatus Methylacidiphilum fumarolicum]TFE69798.1 glucoamylase [Candidatus Methylacidiphilum fumarolicum]TFE71665.1 glycoside hydrolase family 15 protein [Candidatus Methylacidiphilum fumarolicum]TFE72629.1 glycoside hydrolase family 15 protein [Candidatus Methylacidiphilum fumarolicum]TFE76722.1 glucoamylase [Candidatus Methylacidiphilum fumarolicum]